MSQRLELLKLLEDGQPHRTDEIVRGVYGPHCALARVGARINDLRKDGFNIIGWHDQENRKLYWYQLKAADRAIKATVAAPRLEKKPNLPVSGPAFNQKTKPTQLMLIEQNRWD